MASITRIESTKAYVGTAKRAPDSFVPRRLAIAISAMKTSDRTTRLMWTCESKDVTAKAPAAMLTATVRM